MKPDSAKKRYVVTLFVNFFKLAAGVLNSTIVPRALGPVNYGDYNFLSRIFTSFRSVSDLGSTAAFFTYSSKNIKSRNVVTVYYTWILLQLVLTIGLICASMFFGFKNALFPDQKFTYILIIALLEWLNFLSMALIQFGESKAESVFVQKVNFVSQLVKMLVLLALYFSGILTLNSFIVTSYVSSLIIIGWILFFMISKKSLYLVTETGKIKETIKYFLVYCAPLVIYNIFGFIFSFFDRWFLQIISGSVQQAYFSIAFQWSSVAMLFSSSVTNIYWRESSFAFGNKDFGRIKHVYTRLFSLLIFISTVISCFIAFNASRLLNIFAGREYAGALAVLILMAFYPIFYTLGQINAIFFYAVEEIKLYRNLGIIGMITEIIAAYFFLAPKKFTIPGLELGSLGLAVKSLFLAVIFSNIQLYYVTRFLKVKVFPFLTRQILVILVLVLIMGAISFGFKFICFNPPADIFMMLLSYSLVCAALVYIRPDICGLSRVELISYGKKLKSLTWRYLNL